MEFGSSSGGRKWYNAPLVHYDDSNTVQRLLDIQRETATSTGALAALGASLSLSILYSASRGSKFYRRVVTIIGPLNVFFRYVAILCRYVPTVYAF